jgi:hypothetical protein
MWLANQMRREEAMLRGQMRQIERLSRNFGFRLFSQYEIFQPDECAETMPLVSDETGLAPVEYIDHCFVALGNVCVDFLMCTCEMKQQNEPYYSSEE